MAEQYLSREARAVREFEAQIAREAERRRRWESEPDKCRGCYWGRKVGGGVVLCMFG